MEKPYYSQRMSSSKPSFEDFAARFHIIFNDFVEKGYFKKAGIQGDPKIATKINYSLSKEFVLIFGVKGYDMIPTSENIMSMEPPTLFDLIEFLTDRISKLVKKTPEPIDELILAIRGSQRSEKPIYIYDSKIAQKEWRDALNPYLCQLDPPYQLTTENTIIIRPNSKGLQQLVDSCTSPSEDAQSRIKHAQDLFLKHGATKDDKRSALKDLMDVLEYMRNDLKQHIPNEEKDLFNIANNYAIRHNKPNQITKYDESYLQWFFYTILATIDLVTELQTREL